MATPTSVPEEDRDRLSNDNIRDTFLDDTIDCSPDARLEIEQRRERVSIGVNLLGGQTVSRWVSIAGIGEGLNQLGGNLKITRVEPGTRVEA